MRKTIGTALLVAMASVVTVAAERLHSMVGSLSWDPATAREEAAFSDEERADVEEAWFVALRACGRERRAGDLRRPSVAQALISEVPVLKGRYVAGLYVPDRHLVVVEQIDFATLVHEMVHAVVALTEGKRRTADERYVHGIVDAFNERLREELQRDEGARGNQAIGDSGD